jgi:hypothetical protein
MTRAHPLSKDRAKDRAKDRGGLMSAIRTYSASKHAPDHFQPEDSDPQAQKRIRAAMEQIDYTAFASNKAVIAQVIGELDSGRLQRLAVAAASARARWIGEALAIADAGPAGAGAHAPRLAELRAAYLELAEAYEGARRLVERGYVPYRAPPGA